MVGIHPERIVVCPHSRAIPERCCRIGIAVFRIIAIQISKACRRFIINRRSKNRHCKHIGIELRQSRSAAVKLIHRPRHAHAEGQLLFVMLPCQFVIPVSCKFVFQIEERIAQEIPIKMRVAVDCAPNSHDVAFRQFHMMLQVKCITLIGHSTTPVAIIPFIRIVPMTVVAVGIKIPSIVSLEMTFAKIAQPPPQRLAKRNAIFAAQIKASGASKPVSVRRMLSRNVIDVLVEQIRAPTARVAWHHAQTIIRIQRIVPIRHPRYRNAIKIRPHPLEHHELVALPASFAFNSPMQARRIIGTSGDYRFTGNSQRAGYRICGDMLRIYLHRRRALGFGKNR